MRESTDRHARLGDSKMLITWPLAAELSTADTGLGALVIKIPIDRSIDGRATNLGMGTLVDCDLDLDNK